MIKSILNSPLINKELFTEFKYDILKSLLSENAHNTIEEIISWYTTLKTETELSIERCHLSELDEWILSDEKIYH
ncbi:MAG: hypothetical protein PF482_12630, partial [Desulfobacteraceae bacterium]|nr:hypothetical protein [Desulfobacteraceae bacterium]